MVETLFIILSFTEPTIPFDDPRLMPPTFPVAFTLKSLSHSFHHSQKCIQTQKWATAIKMEKLLVSCTYASV